MNAYIGLKSLSYPFIKELNFDLPWFTLHSSLMLHRL